MHILTTITGFCTLAAVKSLLLFAHGTDIRQVSLDTDVPVDVIIPLSDTQGAMALDWDDQTGQLFWTDHVRDSISVSNLNVRKICMQLYSGKFSIVGFFCFFLCFFRYGESQNEKSTHENLYI